MTEDIDLVSLPILIQDGNIAPTCVKRLAGDASNRLYYRAHYPRGFSTVFVVYGQSDTDQMMRFLSLHGFLQDLKLPVPDVYAYDSADGLIVQEDLGDNLLEELFGRFDRERIRQLYVEAIDLIVTMQQRTSDRRAKCYSFNPPFDETKFMEELNFFVTHFVRGLLALQLPDNSLKHLERFFHRLCIDLAGAPKTFCHRDFHARNLILHNDRLVMIDFQDARMGPAQYDLASLLRDSYVTLDEDLVNELLDRYYNAAYYRSHASSGKFLYLFDVMSLQRNLKALGTFGYQVSVRGNRRYLSAIPRTRTHIYRTIRSHQEFGEYVAMIDDVVCGPSLDLSERCV